MSQYVPQYTVLFILLCLQIIIAMTHWSGTRPLASATLSVLEPYRSLGYPLFGLQHGDPAVFDL